MLAPDCRRRGGVVAASGRAPGARAVPGVATQPRRRNADCGDSTRDRPLVEAPLTAKRGVAMLTSADILYKEPAGPTTATPYLREEQAYDFVVRDGSGVARVRGARARV